MLSQHKDMIIKDLLILGHENPVNIRFMRRTYNVNKVVVSICSFGVFPQAFIDFVKSKISLKLFQTISLVAKQAYFTITNTTFNNNLNNPLAELYKLFIGVF
jgi:hypothetical protein